MPDYRNDVTRRRNPLADRKYPGYVVFRRPALHTPYKSTLNAQLGPHRGLPPCRGGGAYAPMTRTII